MRMALAVWSDVSSALNVFWVSFFRCFVGDRMGGWLLASSGVGDGRECFQGA